MLAGVDTQAPSPSDDAVLMLPLGGCGEIGMNMTLYGHGDDWIAVDLGITFGNDAFPDYDVLMPDTAFIETHRDRLRGILLTHGHEDHIGAVPYLWRRLGCPLYATPFTADLVRSKLARAGIDDAPLIEVRPGRAFSVGAFDVEYIHVTHSIPEPNMLLLRTRAGAVLHTGDWKLDPAPVVGKRCAADRLRGLRGERLLAMACDSTNAVVPGTTGSEGDLLAPLSELAATADGRVIVTSFASNVARLVTLARVAQATDRRFGVIGQAMQRMLGIAQANGYWPQDLPPLVDARHLGYLPRSEVLAACTGSQGEPRAALARMAADAHRDILLDVGDTVIFSSRLIPGNERPVTRLEERLRGLGVRVVTDRDAHVHVSGHPAQQDLRQLYDWVQPPCVIPIHGTPRHLAANAAIAADCHAAMTPVIGNGDLVRLDAAGPSVIHRVATGRLTPALEGVLERVPAATLEAMRADCR